MKLHPIDYTKVFAIIVAYNGEDFLPNCINSLLKSNFPVKVIVVDNASKDNTLTKIEKYNEIEIIRLRKNVGFGKANNIGIKRALEFGVDYVFLINQDARIDPFTVDFLLEASHHIINWGIISPMQLNGNGTALDYKFYQAICKSNQKLLSDAYIGKLERSYSVRFAPAAAWLISRDCLLSVGGFDPLFFMYGEDDDLCNRTIFHKYNIVVVPNSKIFHHRSQIILDPKIKKSLRDQIGMRKTSMLIYLKHPEGLFIGRILHLLIKSLSHLFHYLVEFNYLKAIAEIMSVLIIFVYLPRIYIHRVKCQKIGSNWI